MACAIRSNPSIPLSAACQADVGISAVGQPVPSVNLQVKISIPIKELLQALSQISPTVPMGGSGSSGSSHQDSKVVPAVPAVSPVPVVPKVSNDSNISRVSSLTQRTSVTAVTSVTSKPPFGVSDVSGSWESEMRRSVRVSNLLKRMSSQHLKQTFGHHVGPVCECSVEQEGAYRLTFSSEEHARKAVEKYHGGLLEITNKTAKTDGTGPKGDGRGGDFDFEISLWPNSATIECLQDHVGPLSKCSLRGGEGWLTLFVSSRAQQLKHERGQSSIAFKATFISVCHMDHIDGAGDISHEYISFLQGLPVDL